MKKAKDIHLISRTEETPAVHEHIPTARLQKFGYIADIIVSNQPGAGTIYHYVVQPEGSNEIVFWGQELSFKRALDSVESFFEPFRQALRAA
jgi:hypothetical protein